MSYTQENSQEKALSFLFSVRGRLIMSQALHHALKVMRNVQPEVMQEQSNIADMQYLRDLLFDFPDFAFEPVPPEILETLNNLKQN